MWIMKKDGWKPLEVRNCVRVVRQEYPNGPYRGPLPSAECLSFIERVQTEVAEQRAARAQAAGADSEDNPAKDEQSAQAVLIGSATSIQPELVG